MILHATSKDLIIKESERLISGSVKIYTCEFTFDESWDGYAKTVVFASSGSRLVNVALLDNVCEIPPEVLRPNARVRIGLYGTDGVRSRPTTYSDWITVEQGADVSGETAKPPTPSIYDQWIAALDRKHDEWASNEHFREEAEHERVLAERARVEAEKAREDLETGYVAQAKAHAESAAQSQKSAAIADGQAQGAAESAEHSAAIAKVSEDNALNHSFNAAYSAAQAKASEDVVSTSAANAEEARRVAEAAKDDAEEAQRSAAIANGQAQNAAAAAEECAEQAEDAANLALNHAQAAAENADRAEAAVAHPPYVGDNGNWYEWDENAGAFVDSGVGAQGPRGDNGVTTPVSGFFTLAVDENGDLWAYSEDDLALDFEYDAQSGNLYVVQEV